MIDLSFRLFLFILAFAPLAFGTVEHWSLMVVEIGAGVVLILAMIGNRRSGDGMVRVPGMLPLALFLGFMMVQLVPLPPWLLNVVAPMSWQAYQPVHDLSGGGGWLPVSVNQKATVQELLRIGSYGLFYILTVQILRTGARIDRTLKFLALLGSVIAFVAILQQVSGSGMIYWFRAAPGGHPGGPWININQYAAFMAALCPIVLALFLYYRPVSAADSTLRDRLVSLFSSPQSNLHLFLGFGFVLMALSVFVSLCRGGIATILLSLILFAALTSYKRRNLRNTTFWAALCIVLLGVTWFGWQPIIDEFDKTFDAAGAIRDARMQLWSDTLAMIGDHLLLGSGFGTYIDVYPSYKTIAGNLIFDHAHNDYLELLSDGGVVGFGLAAWFCGAVLIHGLRKVMARGDRLAVLVGIGAITSITALLMHSLVDFNLHNGAVGLYFFFICGLLVAVVNLRYSRFREETLLPPMSRRTGAALLTLGGVFVACTTLVQLSILIAAHSSSKTSHIYVTRHLDPELAAGMKVHLETAMRFDPLDGRYPFYRGNLTLVDEGREAALDAYLDAARNQPLQGVYLQRLAMTLPPEQDDEARNLMAMGYRRALDKDALISGWAEWLLMTQRREDAIDLLRQRLSIDSTPLAGILPMLQMHDFTRSQMESILPPRPDAWIRCGQYLENTGDLDGSRYFREKALTHLENESQTKVAWILQLLNFYRRHKDPSHPDKILQTIRLGIAKVPDYAPFHIWLGDHYKKEGITYRAREEYEQAILLAPNKKSYQRKLNQLTP